MRRPLLLLVLLAFAAGAVWWATAERGEFLLGGNPPAGGDDPAGQPQAGAGTTDRQTAAASGATSAPSAPASGPAAPTHPCRMHVEVVTESGTPLPGCRVAATSGDAQVSDALGRASLTIDGDGDWLEVHGPSPEYVSRNGPLRPARQAELTVQVVLRRDDAERFHGRVVDGTASRPVAGAALELFARNVARGSAVSGSDGTFEFLVDPRHGWIRVDAPGFGPARVATLPGHDRREAAFDVVLRPAAELVVQVVDRADRPLAGRLVRVEAFGIDLTQPDGFHRGPWTQTWEARTDAAGEARSTGLPSRVPVRVLVPQGGGMRLWREVQLAPGRNEHRYVAGGLAIAGVVRDARTGAGIAGLAIAARMRGAPEDHLPPDLPANEARTVRSGDGGAFRFEDVDAGDWLVGVTGTREWTKAVARVAITDERSPAVELSVHPARFVAGRVTLPDGRPAAQAALSLQQLDGRDVAGTQAAADGSFRIGPLAEGDYLLDTEPYWTTHGLLRPVRVTAGDEDLQVRLEPVGGTLRARVVDAGGRPDQAWVMMQRRDADQAVGERSAMDGRIRHDGLHAGVWDLIAQDDAGNVAVAEGVRIEPGVERPEVQLQLAPGGTIVVRAAAASAVRSFDVERDGAVVYRDNLPSRSVTRVTVPPGRWTVRFHGSGKQLDAQTVSVRTSGVHEVTPRD